MKIFVDIDTQNDFMNEEGALYVPGAENIKAELCALTAHAIKEGIPIVRSVDIHTVNDPEFKVFPPHCIEDTVGAKKTVGITYVEFVPLKKTTFLRTKKNNRI